MQEKQGYKYQKIEKVCGENKLSSLKTVYSLLQLEGVFDLIIKGLALNEIHEEDDQNSHLKKHLH